MTDLARQKVLVIGGTSGIGHGVARAALAAGAEVTVASSNPDRVAAAIARLGGGEGATLDVSEEAAVERFFAAPGLWNHIVFTAADWAQVDHSDLAAIDLGVPPTSFASASGARSPSPSTGRSGWRRAAR